MGETEETISVRCALHLAKESEVFTRIQKIETELRDMKVLLSKKIDSDEVERRLEVQADGMIDLKRLISDLTKTDANHGEALVGINAILIAIKESQTLFQETQKSLQVEIREICRDRTTELRQIQESYTILTQSINSLNSMFMEVIKDKKIENAPIIESEIKSGWPIIKLFVKTYMGTTVVSIILLLLALTVVGNTTEILEFFKMLFVK